MNIRYMIQGHQGRGIVPPWKYIVDEELDLDTLDEVEKSIRKNWLVKHVSPSSSRGTSTFLVVLRFSFLRKFTVTPVAKAIARTLGAHSFWLEIHDHERGQIEQRALVMTPSGNYL